MVDEYLRVQGHKDIYVIGDNADTKYSGMAQTAIHNARYVAANFISIKNNKMPKTYKSVPPLYVVTGGGPWAVVQKGKKVISGRRGWRVRRQADMTIFKNFEPYKKAIKTWRAGNKLSRNL